MNAVPDSQSLSIPERLDLLERIWERLTSENAVPELTTAQKLEIDQRLLAYDAAPSTGRSWVEARGRGRLF